MATKDKKSYQQQEEHARWITVLAGMHVQLTALHSMNALTEDLKPLLLRISNAALDSVALLDSRK